MEIVYRGKSYPVVDTQYGFVSVKSLQSQLVGEDGCLRDERAYDIGRRIFFFVPDREISNSVAGIEKYVRENRGK